MREDLKSAFRSLRSGKGFTVAALLVLTLGIGATAAIFSVVDAVVLRGMPFDDQDRLVAVGQRTTTPATAGVLRRDPARLMFVAPQNYSDWAAQQEVFESIAAIASGWGTLRLPGVEPESLVPQLVTAGFFDVLRRSPSLGRAFTTANEAAGADRVVVLSDALWRRRFGADPGIIGRTIPIELLEAEGAATGYEVIGVMPPDFAYPVGAARPTEIWVPYVVPEADRVRVAQRMSTYLQVIARLKDGVSIEQAQAQMDQIASALERAHPVWNRNSRIGVRQLVDHVVGADIKSWLMMLLAAVAMVLLIAAANIASLLLARATVRERDIAVRAALGAGRWRLVRQLLVESLVLAAGGAVLGVAFAWWAVDVLRAAMPDGVPRVTTIALDPRVLAVAIGVALVTGAICGLTPALQMGRPDLTRALRESGRSGTSPGRRRLRSILVVAEVALAVVLLVGAALFIGSFVAIMRNDPGFDPSNVLTAQISPPIGSRSSPTNRSLALMELVERIDAIPGVEHAAMLAGQLPLTDGVTVSSFPFSDAPGGIARVSTKTVTPGYHQALRIPLLRGRLFTAADRDGAPRVGVLNQAAVATYFAGVDPIGRTFNGATIVGIVGDARQNGVERDAMPEMYTSLAQSKAAGANLVVRTSGDPYDTLTAVRAAVFAVLPDVPLRNVTTMDEMFARRVAQRRLNMLLLGLFGLLGLTIAAVGIYGLMAFVVAQRTREIGVRMALGASRARVVGTIGLHALALVAAGLAVGCGLAWYFAETARAFLFGVGPTDLRAFGVAAGSILLAAALATFVPAWRAASVDPVVALRTE